MKLTDVVSDQVSELEKRESPVDINVNATQAEKDIQHAVFEYCKALYEEENKRTERLNDAVKVYLAFLTFILGMGALKTMSMDSFLHLLNDGRTNRDMAAIAVFLFASSLLSLFASLVFTILILKIWRFAILGDPGQIALRACFMTSEYELVSAVIAGYVVAVNTNHKINDSKARLLSRALFFLVVGLILFVVSLFVVNAVTILGGMAP